MATIHIAAFGTFMDVWQIFAELIKNLKTCPPLLPSPRSTADVACSRAFDHFAKKSSVYYKSRIGPTRPACTVTVFKTFSL
jgi:hypothetical protein